MKNDISCSKIYKQFNTYNIQKCYWMFGWKIFLFLPVHLFNLNWVNLVAEINQFHILFEPIIFFMSKATVILFILLSLPHLFLFQNLLLSSTNCLSNCLSCTQDKSFECPYLQSPIVRGKNLNCLPFYEGNNCKKISSGFYETFSNDLKIWNSTANTCKIDISQISAVGPIQQNNQIEGRVTIPQNGISLIKLKFSFLGTISDPFTQGFFSTQNQARIFSTDEATGGQLVNQFVSVSITGEGISQSLRLFAKAQPQSSTQTSCGTVYQFTSDIQLPTQIDSTRLTIRISPIGENTFYLNSLNIYVGCSGFTLSTASQKCSQCISGFYAERNTDTTLAGCQRCDLNCETCTTNGVCKLCSPRTTFNSTTQKCQLNKNIEIIDNFDVVSGNELKKSDVFKRPVFTQTNKINLKGKVRSKSSYMIRFFLLYKSQFIATAGPRQVLISEGTQSNVIKRINIVQNLQVNYGSYDRQFNSGVDRLYPYKVQIDQYSDNIDENQEQQIDIFITTNGSSVTDINQRIFGVSDFEVLEYRCENMCSKCNAIVSSCEECSNFFDINTNCQICSNGFFLKKYWGPSYINNGVEVLNTTTEKADSCIKCHTTCKQCVDENMNSCIQCFDVFVLRDLTFDNQCIECLHNAKNNSNVPDTCQRCLLVHSNATIQENKNCKSCLNKRNGKFTEGTDCEECWVLFGLAKGRCISDPLLGYHFYGTDVNDGIIERQSWKGFSEDQSIELKTLNCQEYKNIWGIPHSDKTTTEKMQSLEWTQTNLPPHRGLIIMFNLLKINNWEKQNKNDKNFINVHLLSGNEVLTDQNQTIINSRGSNICAGLGNEMIFTYLGVFQSHFQDQTGEKNLILTINSTGDGLYISQLQVYLGNCEQCRQDEVSSSVQYMPRYFTNESQTGLDLYLTFNKPVQYSGSNKSLEDSFTFSLQSENDVQLPHTEFMNDLYNNQRLHYFLPLEKNLLNDWLTVNTTENNKFYLTEKAVNSTARLLMNSRLNNPQSNQTLQRYSNVMDDSRYSMNQIYWFFVIFQWIALIGMIISTICGVSVIMEEFSILLQLIFLHVYIASFLIPATFKAPMRGLQRMQNLNYFVDPATIQNDWFGDYVNPCPFIFQQYNVDNYFLRSFYPTIIINIIYLCWFLLLFFIHKCSASFRDTSSKIGMFLRAIPQRPLNYFDQIWRYQFITVLWSSFIQFYQIRNDEGFQRFNLAICFMALIISFLYPFITRVYLYKIQKIQYGNNFLQRYEDMFFRKMTSFGEESPRLYGYIGIRFLGYFLTALFIAIFINHELIGPLLLLVINAFEIAFLFVSKVYEICFKLFIMKVVELGLFMALQVMFLFVYGLSTETDDEAYLNLGYSMIVVCVMMVLLGIVRIFFIMVMKYRSLSNNWYGIDVGEKKQYKNTPLPIFDSKQ